MLPPPYVKRSGVGRSRGRLISPKLTAGGSRGRLKSLKSLDTFPKISRHNARKKKKFAARRSNLLKPSAGEKLANRLPSMPVLAAEKSNIL